MSDRPPMHRFDEARAASYRPSDEFEKTAILVEVPDPDAETVITAPFGEQRLTGSFYVVAEGDASYGAARSEFEQSHTSVGPQRWVKSAPVAAYRAKSPCVVETVVDGRVETTVTARQGDWIVRHRSGEVTVVGPDEFAERYVSQAPTTSEPS